MRGRGAGVGRVMAGGGGRAPTRRVAIKARIVRLAGKGSSAAIAHLRYLQRDGTTHDGERGTLYGPHSDAADGKEFLARGADDRQQFRLIVSAEDGAEYGDLKPLTRRLMAQAEVDLGTSLDWVAVDHHNTGHPHTHILVRGVGQTGRDLVIARDYLSAGLRARACELVELDLGPPSRQHALDRARRDMTTERLTQIDRELLRDADAEGIVSAHGQTPIDQALRTGRLGKLQTLGLAEPLGAGRWKLRDGLEESLRTLSERGDIIRTMQREFARTGQARAATEQLIYDPSAQGAQPLIGRVLARGLADEHRDQEYLIVDATDGRSHYVPIGRGAIDDDADLFGEGRRLAGSIVRITPARVEVRPADRTIAAVAAANGGSYDADAHRRYDPRASADYIAAHVRRLEAVRRSCRAAQRGADGSWAVRPDYLERVASEELARIKMRPVQVEIVASTPLRDLAYADAATWLDRELVGPATVVPRDMGFGAEVEAALQGRRQWLAEQGLITETQMAGRVPAIILRTLERREIATASARIAAETGLAFAPVEDRVPVSGVYRRSIDLASGRFAVVERVHDFTLVPWRPALEGARGKSVTALIHGDKISWSLAKAGKGIARDDF